MYVLADARRPTQASMWFYRDPCRRQQYRFYTKRLDSRGIQLFPYAYTIGDLHIDGIGLQGSLLTNNYKTAQGKHTRERELHLTIAP